MAHNVRAMDDKRHNNIGLMVVIYEEARPSVPATLFIQFQTRVCFDLAVDHYRQLYSVVKDLSAIRTLQAVTLHK